VEPEVLLLPPSPLWLGARAEFDDVREIIGREGSSSPVLATGSRRSGTANEVPSCTRTLGYHLSCERHSYWS
jgi:hypothetical protein